MQRTRENFFDNAKACITEVKNGRVKLPSHTFLGDYFDECEKRGQAALNGEYDHTLTFLQHAHWIQTGDMIALLP